MPYTAKQRRYFHAQAAKGKPGMAALAKEADSMPVRTPVRKAAKKAARKAK
jgi:hypothetical protein